MEDTAAATASGARIEGSDAGPPGSAPTLDFAAEPEVVRVVVEAERLAYGHLFNPAFATEISLIDPLPHQRIAVYEQMLPQPRLRFLLADEPAPARRSWPASTSARCSPAASSAAC